MQFISERNWQFSFLARHLNQSNYEGKNILDFGGNVGGILCDPASTIELQRYWCIDVCKEAVAQGRETHPEAHWIYYDRYSFEFNPLGVAGLPVPDPGIKFDLILAYSVFTHVGATELVDLVAQLDALLAPNGTLVFTYYDPHHMPCPQEYGGDTFQWRLENPLGIDPHPTVNVAELTSRAAKARWCVLVNYEDLYVESDVIRNYDLEEKKAYIAFYSSDFIRSLFPHASISEPCDVERDHHCCIIRRTEHDAPLRIAEMGAQ